jgi:hypothetical protein
MKPDKVRISTEIPLGLYKEIEAFAKARGATPNTRGTGVVIAGSIISLLSFAIKHYQDVDIPQDQTQTLQAQLDALEARISAIENTNSHTNVKQDKRAIVDTNVKPKTHINVDTNVNSNIIDGLELIPESEICALHGLKADTVRKKRPSYAQKLGYGFKQINREYFWYRTNDNTNVN